MTLDADEQAILESVERGEWHSTRNLDQERSVYSRDAAATFRRDRRINIRISTRDLDAIQKRALEEGLPYQTSSPACFTSTRRAGCDDRGAGGAPVTPAGHSGRRKAMYSPGWVRPLTARTMCWRPPAR